MNQDEARAALRVANKLYHRDLAKFRESEYNRERTAFLASEAGISDVELARWYDMPRETARRLRLRHQTRLGLETPAAVLERRPGGVTRFPSTGLPDSRDRCGMGESGGGEGGEYPTGVYPTGANGDGGG